MSCLASAAAVAPLATRARSPRARAARGVRRHVTLATADDAASSPAPALTRRDAVLGAAALAVLPANTARAAEPLKESFYDYTVQQYGKPFDLGAFRGNVTVVLNVASE
jgi:glutathione peroxidase